MQHAHIVVEDGKGGVEMRHRQAVIRLAQLGDNLRERLVFYAAERVASIFNKSTSDWVVIANEHEWQDKTRRTRMQLARSFPSG
jgi:hypothetical protein